jgi:hypothetical protein
VLLSPTGVVDFKSVTTIKVNCYSSMQIWVVFKCTFELWHAEKTPYVRKPQSLFMKYFFLLTSFFSIIFQAKAQSNYKPGYIVNNKNDTIKGFIDQRERYNNPTEFELKTSLDQPAKKYSIEDIISAGIIGYSYFEKFTTTVSTGYTALSRLKNALDTGYDTKTILLRVVNKGVKISLYAYTDNVKTRFFIFDNEDKKLAELNYYAYYNEDTRSVITSAKYQGQLFIIGGKYLPGNTKKSI